MAELNLDELERLAKAATPGPWEWWTSNSFLRLTGADRRDGGVLYACNIRNEYATVVVSEADRRFIAEARTALPALIARIRELERRADARQVLERIAASMRRGGARLPVDVTAMSATEQGLSLGLLLVEDEIAAIDAARKEKGHG